ncbi:hypothetical protein [Ramlibacter albus]|uniref:DUF5666 domain-containing protein n=1 Tax=Ramlibacter albus TaxID=2079448 RepID=A0A923S644_9BURK|nr:hypothetical protein [Ramlibacter albus]MBC5765787.1 hypothetical protein [Ramlibacter albus]
MHLPDGSRRSFIAAALVLAACAARSQPAAPTRLRGNIDSLGPDKLVLRERSGKLVELVLAPNLAVTEVYPVAFSDIQPGSFIGAGAMPQADGSQKAIAVLLFPEAMRGTGEGHRPFDFLPQSTMTNATVAGVAASSDGRRLRVTYPGGEQTIVVPPEAPVFSLKPGTRDLLVQGAQVSLTAQDIDGKPTATRISAGRNGFSPPY